MARKTPNVIRHPAALRDLVEIGDYLARTASLTVANRFINAADSTIRRLARMPGLGSLWTSDKPRLAEVRFFPITKFRNYLSFYRPLKDGIEMIRVLHGARNLANIFEPEEGP